MWNHDIRPVAKEAKKLLVGNPVIISLNGRNIQTGTCERINAVRIRYYDYVIALNAHFYPGQHTNTTRQRFARLPIVIQIEEIVVGQSDSIELVEINSLKQHIRIEFEISIEW